jgi:hypothetical protein
MAAVVAGELGMASYTTLLAAVVHVGVHGVVTLGR